MTKTHAPARLRWARLRFSVVGQLLTAPPEPGQLRTELEALAARSWEHPSTGDPVKFGVSTIARWFYAARNEPLDPVARLERKTHALAEKHPAVSEIVRAAMRAQHREHPTWSFKLHHDNLLALAKSRAELLPLPSYPTLRRWMQSDGLLRKRKKRRDHEGPGFAPREQRSFEVSHVHALWHLDFHQGSRSVLLPSGEWKKPVLLGVLGDCSRLCCHLQWFLEETAESLVHAFMQALQKRGLPRMLLTDNGAPMLAAETREGFERLGIARFALITGDPGTGKSIALRVLAARLRGMRDVVVGSVDHPQSGVLDFYRELADLFGIAMPLHNRWAGFKALRARWAEHIASSHIRPVLIIDEAQEMIDTVFSELRLLASKDFDSRSLLCVVFAGDRRLIDRFRRDQLLPLATRIRRRIDLDFATRDELCACLDHVLDAGLQPTRQGQARPETPLATPSKQRPRPARAPRDRGASLSISAFLIAITKPES